jgi:hypothetical protein
MVGKEIMLKGDFESYYCNANCKNVVRFEVSTAVTMMIIIFWEMVLIRATRRHLPEDDNHHVKIFPTERASDATPIIRLPVLKYEF